MSAPVAVILAAAVAAAVTLVSQFLANELAVRRDRRNQRRERTREVFLQAARALHVTTPLTDEEYGVLDFAPGTVGAVAPDSVRATRRFSEAWFHALTELQIELGHDDPLIDSYVEVAQVCSAALVASFRMSSTRDEAEDGPSLELTEDRKRVVEDTARALREAQLARDRWAREARARLDSI